jgi:hypothetical protein
LQILNKTKDAFHTDEKVIYIGKDQLEKRFRIGFDILMNFVFAPVADVTDILFLACRSIPQ